VVTSDKNGAVDDSTDLRPSLEIRSYLHQRINSAIRRLGMFGGEVGLTLLCDALAFVERRDVQWEAERALLRSRGASSSGVAGAMGEVLPDGQRDEAAIGSVYAELAARLGWLRLDRSLSDVEQHGLADGVRGWAAIDRRLTDVLVTWGEPSVWLGGRDPLPPQTLAYALDDVRSPLVCFHLWNQITPTESPDATAAFDEPRLLIVRFGDGPFTDTLTFTPEGTRRRP
jgi:hypothetical protein